jgi:glycosyltransferase involved in cell wall biosynthesis
MDGFSLVVPYYRNIAMLREQIRVWESYPAAVAIVLVDDGSPEEARSIVLEHASPALRERIALYRIGVDIAWNRGGARNLGTARAETDWIVHVDIDHVLPAACAERLLAFSPDPFRWYRFERFRNGRADETRRKDKIPEGAEFGKIHPHIDSYLCTRDLYWAAGGYNEDFSGCLGGGSPFLAELEKVGQAPLLAPADAHLLVYTRSVVRDASDHTLSRERGEFARRKATMKGRFKGHRPLRFPWTRQDLCIPA